MKKAKLKPVRKVITIHSCGQCEDFYDHRANNGAVIGICDEEARVIKTSRFDIDKTNEDNDISNVSPPSWCPLRKKK